jgi:hypothetical protein
VAVGHSRVSVGTTATRLSSTALVDQTVVVQNPDSTVTVYLGGSGVTTSSYGYALGPGQSFTLQLTVAEGLFGVVASSSLTVNTLTQGV